MSRSQVVRRLVIVLCCLLIATGAVAQPQQAQQAQQAQQFQPQVGQAGKDVVWVPTPQAVVDKMLDLAAVRPTDYVIDLGSGDGRTVITAAKRGARALGIEFNPDMVELSKRNAAEAGVSNKATFVKADLFEADLSEATVITMFLLPDINMKLRPKILGLRPGTRIVSNSFTMEDWEADETATVAEECENWCTALFWVVPARVEGTWHLPDGELTLTQRFQMLSGTLKTAKGSTPIANGRLRGNRISFSSGAAFFNGRVSGNAMKGTSKQGASVTSWTATRRAH